MIRVSGLLRSITSRVEITFFLKIKNVEEIARPDLYESSLTP